ncbi:MAG: oligopeptide/dipeptide ABC transporter ATP-binding protein [Bacillota bacterium]
MNSGNLLEVNDLKKYFPVQSSLAGRLFGQRPGWLKAVDGVDLFIREGETLGLVGESGSGKSTLGRTVVGLYEATAGEVLFEGRPVQRQSPQERKSFRQKVQMIFQNPYSSLNPRKTVRQILDVPLRMRGVPAPERLVEMEALLDRVGLNRWHLDQYPHQFSGGQRQRIGIARALAMHPRFIVADEPVSALDVSVQAQIINLLMDLQEQFRLTYLFIAHDINVVHHISSRIAVMYLGRVVEIAGSEELLTAPRHPYTKALISAIPEISKTRRRERILLEGTIPSPLNPPPGCCFQTRCPEKKGPVCAEIVPQLKDVGGDRFVACHLYER